MEEIRNRRSIRKYKSTPVSKEDILKIIEAARLAPSGSNTQPWRFLVVTNEALKQKIVRADHDQKWMLQAPVFIVCMADMGCRAESTAEEIYAEDSPSPELKLVIRDTAIAVSYMLLECEHLGYGSCWTGWYDQKDMHAVLDVPNSYYISGILTLGIADEAPKMRPRKEMDEILTWME